MFRLFTVSVEAGNWKVKLSLLARSFFIVALSYPDNISDAYFEELYEECHLSFSLLRNTCVLNLLDQLNCRPHLRNSRENIIKSIHTLSLESLNNLQTENLNFVSFYLSYHDKLFSCETKIREYKVVLASTPCPSSYFTREHST